MSFQLIIHINFKIKINKNIIYKNKNKKIDKQHNKLNNKKQLYNENDKKITFRYFFKNIKYCVIKKTAV